MQVLLVKKPTNFELHGDRVKANVTRGRFGKIVLDRLVAAHDEHYRCLDSIIEKLDNKNVGHTLISRDDKWPDTQHFDFVMSVGGDGTLLSASHNLTHGEKIIGIRSSGASVGYTCAAGMSSLDQLINNLMAEQLNFVSVARIGVRLILAERNESIETVPVLNDVLYTNCNPAATSRYSLMIDGVEEVQKSSGLWVSTAVGSTAGILAAGGEALDIKDRCFQYRVRELYQENGRQHQMIGGQFDPDKTKLVIENRNENALIALDGQHGEVLLDFGDQIEFRRGPDLIMAKPELAD